MPPRVPRPPRAGAHWPGRIYDHRWGVRVVHDIYSPDKYSKMKLPNETVEGSKQIASREAQENIEMLQVLKRDMPKEYQTIKDYYSRGDIKLHHSPGAKSDFYDALHKIDNAYLERLPQREIGPLTEIDDAVARSDAYLMSTEGPENFGKFKRTQRATQVMAAMQRALDGGYAPGIVAAPLAHYAVSDQTKTAPRTSKKTSRKKK